MAQKIKDENGNVYIKKKPFFKKIWFWVLAFVVIICVYSATSKTQKNVEVKSDTNTSNQEKAKYEVTDLSTEKDSIGTTYVTGVLKNNTDSTKSYVQVTIPVYDKSGNKLGEALANVNNLETKKTWKFKASYFGSEKDIVVKTDELKVSGF